MTTVAEIFEKLPFALNADAAQGQDCVLQFNLSEPAYLTIKDGACTVGHGTVDGPDLDISLSDEHFVELMQGRLNGVMALMSGKLSIEGDLGLARQMLDFFDTAKLN